jgi:hypothetical protein
MNIETEKIEKIKTNLKKGIPLTMYEPDTLKYINKPIGKAIYKKYENIKNPEYKPNKPGRPRKNVEEKAKPKDIVKCIICPGQYTRSNVSSHNKTKVHLIYLNMHEKLRKTLMT